MRVFLADDHPLFRFGLRIALDQVEGIEVSGEASDGFGLVNRVMADPPDLALVDVDMPGMGGVRAIRMLREAMPAMRLVVLSTYDSEEYIREAMEAGADGYVLKCVDVAELVRIIRGFHEGGAPVSPFLVNLGVAPPPAREPRPDPEVPLTPREREILRRLVTGMSNKEISSVLNISVETVKSHAGNIYEKLQVRNRAEAASAALRRNLLD